MPHSDKHYLFCKTIKLQESLSFLCRMVFFLMQNPDKKLHLIHIDFLISLLYL